MIDLWTTRRDNFIKCTYWCKIDNNDIVSLSEVVHERVPSGTFYAKEITPWNEDPQIIDATFKFSSKTVTVETYDKVDNLHEGDVVKLDDFLYRVQTIQTLPIKKQRHFLKSGFSCKRIIDLRG